MLELAELIVRRDFKRPLLKSFKYQVAHGVEAYDTTTLFDEPLGGNPLFRDHVKHWIRNRGPAGWTQRRKTLLVKSLLEAVLAVESDDRDALNQLIEDLPQGDWDPLGATSEQVDFILGHSTSKYWEAETQKRIALIALAAERSYLTEQKYPETLRQMQLGFPVVDLTDPEKRELGYQIGPDGRPEIGSLREEESGESENNRRLRWQFWSK